MTAAIADMSHETVHAHLAGRITVAHSYFDKGAALAGACRVHERPPIETTGSTACASPNARGRSCPATG